MAEAEDPASVLAILRQSKEMERRAAEALPRERELLQRIFDTVPLMMTIYEPDTRVLRVNRALERLIGWSTEELVNVSLMEEVYPDPAYRAKAREYMQACLPEWRDFRLRTRDGGEIESSWTNVRLSDDTQLGIGIDITERNRAERALRASEEALRDAHRLKDEFLATLAHELRNPLAPMRSAVEVLRMSQDLGPKSKNALTVLDRQLGVMVRLVEDLLDLSRINTGKIDLRKEQIDLNVVVRRSVESSRPFFRAREHELTVKFPEGPVLVEGDPVRLEQVFNNLLNNASKFTPVGGRISLEVEPRSGEAFVRVLDSGIGLAPQMLPRIFEMFVQADQRIDRAQPGLGIGLSLVKRLLELHGGRVSASSAGVDQGSEFVARLPLATAPRPDVQGIEVRTPFQSATGRKILVVDDNADAAETLAEVLTLAGHEAFTAESAIAGIELARMRRVDAIVMDLGMPGMNGYEAARAIRGDPRLRDVLLISLSGWGEEQTRRKSAEAGFDHHLVKPVDLTTLGNLLHR